MAEDINYFLSTIPDTLIPSLENSTFHLNPDKKPSLKQNHNLDNAQNKLLLLKKLQDNSLYQSRDEIEALNFFETLLAPWIKEAKNKSLKVFIYIDPNLPKTITLDKESLSFILQELILNAIKFTPKGACVHIDIRQSYLNDKEHLSLSISDSGIGMHKAKVAKLFKAFLGKTNTGFSLGLAASYFLLKALGSELKISSELSKGSRFSFSLPFWAAEKSALSPKKSLHIGILQEDSHMDDYTRQLFSYLLALGSKLINIENANDPKLAQCQALFIVNKTFSRSYKSSIHKNYPECIIIPAYLEIYHKNFSLFKHDDSYKLLFPLLPSAMLDCFAYITSEIALQSMEDAPRPKESLDIYELKQEKVEANDTLQILLVEDNAINIKWTLMLLGRYDYDIDYAENGEIAVDMVKRKRYDLILMDIDMPIMNGIEATQHIKLYEKENALKHTPIVALTSHDQEGERENILAQGLDEHLGKPLKLTELEELLTRYNEEKYGLKL